MCTHTHMPMYTSASSNDHILQKYIYFYLHEICIASLDAANDTSLSTLSTLSILAPSIVGKLQNHMCLAIRQVSRDELIHEYARSSDYT